MKFVAVVLRVAVSASFAAVCRSSDVGKEKTNQALRGQKHPLHPDLGQAKTPPFSSAAAAFPAAGEVIKVPPPIDDAVGVSGGRSSCERECSRPLPDCAQRCKKFRHRETECLLACNDQVRDVLRRIVGCKASCERRSTAEEETKTEEEEESRQELPVIGATSERALQVTRTCIYTDDLKRIGDDTLAEASQKSADRNF